MTARLDVTPKTTERNRILRTNKSEAEVTNNKILRSRYCIIEATKHTDRPEASRGLFATAELLVVLVLLLYLFYH